MENRIRGIGFDLGDTLLFYRDTPLSWVSLYPAALQCVAQACKTTPTPEQFAAAGKILGQHNTRIVPRIHEIPAEEILSQVLRSWELDSTAHLPDAIDAFFSFFQQKMDPYPETLPVLESLRKKGLPIGILTDVPYGMPRDFVQRDVDRAGIAGLFDTLLTSVEVGVRKPEPAGYLALASRLGIQPSEMIYIGNEPKDVIGANRAGVVSVFIDRTGSGASHGQNYTIPSLLEIHAILKENRAA